MAIKHKKAALRPDNSDPSEVQPSDWNDEHSATGVIGEFIDMAATPDTIPYINVSGQGASLPIVTPAKNFLAGPTTAAMLAAIGAVGLASPAFSGNPTAPTPTAGDNDTSIATTAFVQAAISALVASAPGALNTLKELADAIGDDPSFSATITASLGNRLRVDAVQSLTSPQKAQAQSNLGLGTAATKDVGTSANNVVQLDGTGKLPAVDASQLTNVPSGAAGAGYGGTSITSLTPATGSKIFATQTGLAYAIGSRVRATSVSNAAVWMEGIVSAYSSGNLTLNVDTIGTATAKADWVFTIAGTPAALSIGSSTTTLTPSVASKVFATQANLAVAIGTRLRAASNATPAVWMEGQVTGYSGTSLTINIDLIGTASAASDWNITHAGERGQTGAQGIQGIQGVVGPQGIQGVQGPAGTFPTGGGTIGSFALGDIAGANVPLNGAGSPYGGSWSLVSSNFTNGTSLFQRIA